VPGWLPGRAIEAALPVIQLGTVGALALAAVGAWCNDRVYSEPVRANLEYKY
jgi:hypothetical protein